ncbi:MAG: J domain-containing protein [Acidobacteriota bacterium]
MLTLRQQQAYDDLVKYGASLATDFTESELRSAFRVLARMYHPDRHPDCGPAEQDRLSRTFATLADAYRHLMTSSTDAVSMVA